MILRHYSRAGGATSSQWAKRLFATEMSGQLFDGRQDKGTVAFLKAAQQARDHLALVVGATARLRQQFIHPAVEDVRQLHQLDHGKLHHTPLKARNGFAADPQAFSHLFLGQITLSAVLRDHAPNLGLGWMFMCQVMSSPIQPEWLSKDPLT